MDLQPLAVRGLNGYERGLDRDRRILLDPHSAAKIENRRLGDACISVLREPSRAEEECNGDAVLRADLGFAAGLGIGPVGANDDEVSAATVTASVAHRHATRI